MTTCLARLEIGIQCLRSSSVLDGGVSRSTFSLSAATIYYFNASTGVPQMDALAKLLACNSINSIDRTVGFPRRPISREAEGEDPRQLP
jgi:hypothetical protein